MKRRFDERVGSSSLVLVVLGAAWLAVALFLLLYWLFDSPSVEVRWQTETEFETAGFNVLRSDRQDGPFVRINEKLISGAADPAAGGDYLFVDPNVVAGEIYFYRLEDVELDGDRTQHALVSVRAAGKPLVLVLLSAILAVTGLGLIIYAWRASSSRVAQNAEVDTRTS